MDDLKKINFSEKFYLNQWFIRLRWIAIAISFILIIIAYSILHYLQEVTFWPLLFSVFILIVTNIIYKILLEKKIFLDHLEKIQIFVDLLILSAMLQFSGGLENPLSFMYLLHIILSGILLSKSDCYKVVIIATLFYSLIALCELYEIFPHYTLSIYPHTAEETIENTEHNLEIHNHEISQDNLIHAAHYPLYVWSMVFLNFFIMILTAYFVTNIMERLRNEEKETIEKYQWLEKVLQATGTGLLILNNNLVPEWMNEPIKKWIDLKEVTIIDAQNKISWILGKNKEAEKTIKDGITRTIELDKVNNEGQKFFFQITIAPMYNLENKIYQIVELVQDITEKKIIEAEMLHSSKMATVGIMAASIAHEVGNPLSSISTRLKLLESNKDSSFINDSIPLLQREIERIKRIVRGISQFGKPEKDVWSVCNINSIINETVEMLKYHKSSYNCEIKLKLNQNIPNTLGSRDQLKQVFLNLGLNAFESMKDGGKLSIETSNKEGNILIKFEDIGSGMKQEIIDNIFTPFFSTKEQGSGLGLFIVYHIIQAHGGEIKTFSEVNKGSTFIIYLPVQLYSNK